MAMRSFMHLTGAAVLVAAMGLQTGCGSQNRLLPSFVSDPQITVESVRRVAVSPAGSQYEIVLTLTNPNKEPLPLTLASYQLQIGGESYSTQANPNAELPVGQTLTIRLPAAIVAQGNDYSLSGSVHYKPLGQLRDVMTDVGIPLPRQAFRSAGQIVDEATQVAVPAPGEPIVPQPDAVPLARQPKVEAPSE